MHGSSSLRFLFLSPGFVEGDIYIQSLDIVICAQTSWADFKFGISFALSLSKLDKTHLQLDDGHTSRVNKSMVFNREELLKSLMETLHLLNQLHPA